jgi:trk system potassium uptake protein TrkH
MRLLQSALLVAAPASYVVMEALDRAHPFQRVVAPSLASAALAGLVLLAALAMRWQPFLARTLASLAAFVLAGAGAFVLTRSPALALGAVLGLAGGVAWLWYDEVPLADSPEEPEPGAAGVGPECSLALLAWLLVGPTNAAPSEGATAAAIVGIATCMILGARRVLATWPRRGLRLLVTVLLALPPAVSLVGVWRGALGPGHGVNILALGPALLLLWAGLRGKRAVEPSWWSAVLEHPARLLVVTFVSLAGVGAALLSLPAASVETVPVSALEAMFTSVSAVCVTGLIVLDTPNVWTPFGQGVVLALIQLGGLGIMTFYAAAVPLLGRRLSMRHERAIAGALSIDDRGRMYRALGRVLGVTFGCEAAGAAILFVLFKADGQLAGEALWQAVFTSISAFCNAGFALRSDSLMSGAESPLILHTVAALIVLGGLSPVAVVSLPKLLGPRRRTLSLELKLIYLVSAALLVSGTVAFAAFEWNASLGHLGVVDRLHNAWFQSVTLRTAGFNSVDFEETRVATQTMMIFMMFLGGSPGGTAGGMKTTTFAALCLAVLAALQGQDEAQAFRRRLPHTSVYKAAAITTLGILSVIAVVIVLLLSQRLPPQTAVFEVVSALGTVGLSIGGTAQLDEIGQVLIMLCMLAGRVGPLTLFVILVERRYDSAWVYPEEELHVG